MKKTAALLASSLIALAQAHAAPSAQAVEIAHKYVIVDGHVDAPSTIAEAGADIATGEKTVDFDYERAREGGLDAPFMSIYVSADYEPVGGAKARADILIGLMEGVEAQYPDKFEIAYSPKDVRRIFKEGKIALPLGMENGSPIEGDLANLKHFYDRGVRYVTLAHSKSNHISDSSYDENKKWGGLSPFGFEVVRAMNDLGIMVDVSHISDAAIEDVLATTRAPVIASHSSLRHFTPGWERNLPDELAGKVGENGGVIMVAIGSMFLNEAANTYSEPLEAARAAEQKRLGREMTETEQEAFRTAWLSNHPYPFATLDQVLDHIDRAVELAGIDHVGLGSDYDGVGDALPVGLKDVSTYPVIVDGLLERGYDEASIEKILGGNALRVWEEVEDARNKRRKF
ncbi:dipeptidase [Hyphococcus luteus]|uniref:Peptidase M19 n=1 Tax=Hyphococcus luteus TaxID=2058213 RepID=A0A2S7K3G4_9PROT|nr:dipeptidase [Marinicaulis flavus]PQA87026.1 peptidase M19 [Marinicaulis flavus]